MMELNLYGRTVLITGGTKGIGLETALAFGKEGCHVAVCGRNRRDLDIARRQFDVLSIDAITAAADVTDRDEMTAFAEKAYDRWSHIDIWINNAGMPIHKGMCEVTDEEWNAVIATNLTAVFQGCRLAAYYMKKQKNGGVILNAGSFQSFFPAAGSGPYGAAKAGVASLTRSFAGELAKDRIRVITYIPGVIETPMSEVDNWAAASGQLNHIPLNRLGSPKDVAHTLLFLASDVASYMTGTAVEITGGKFCVQNPRYSWENQSGMF